jgi:hypothetical protein
MLRDPRNVTLQNGRGFDVLQLIETYSDIYSELKRCIKDVVEQTNIVTTNSWDYRRWLYREKAPKKYSLCYLSSLEYLAFLARFDNTIYLQTPNLPRDDCIKATTDLHSSTIRIKEFEPFFEILVEFTDTVEDAILKSTIKIQNDTFTSEDLLFLQDQGQIFRDIVWKPFAKVIAIETVKGKRKDLIIEEYTNDLKDLSSVKSQIARNKQKAKNLGLFLTKNEFGQLLNPPEDIRKKVVEAGNILQWG